MASWRDRRLPRELVRRVAGPAVGMSLRPGVSERVSRIWMDTVGRAMIDPIGVSNRWVELGEIKTMIVEHADSDPSCALLYLHGGGYRTNSPIVYRALAGHIAKQAKIRVFLPKYRLAPEHPCPAAIDDAVAVYRSLVAEEKIEPSRIAIGGDSAGGGLALTATVALREAEDELPALLALICPWVDLTASGKTITSNAEREPVLSEDEQLAENLKRAGVEVDYRCFPDVWHVFQGFAGVLEDADLAVAELSEKLRATWPKSAPASVAE